MVRRLANHAFVTLIPILMAIVLLLGHFPLSATGVRVAGNDCGSACPCDDDSEGTDEEHRQSPASHPEPNGGDNPCATVPTPDDGVPSGEPGKDDPCPDDCPGCHCAPGVTLGFLPTFAVPNFSIRRTSEVHSVLPTIAPDGLRSDVFRPPRPLA